MAQSGLGGLLSWFKTRWRERPQPSNVLVWILRGLFGAVVIGLGWVAFDLFKQADDPNPGLIAFFVILGVGLLVLFSDVMVRNKQITTVSAVYFGLLLGLLLGSIFSNAIQWMVPPDWYAGGKTPERYRVELRHAEGKPDAKPEMVLVRESSEGAAGYPERFGLIRLMITVICCYISISTLLQTKDEFRFIIPYVEFSKQVKGGRPLVLDTSVIIDGRIADICDTRFIDAKLIVPRFVLQELQAIADSSDKLKRNRGRRGLDMLKRMQTNAKIELQMHEAILPEMRDVTKVDERLVVLAKALGARVVTNDFNLNKIAQLQGVEVINLNELANSLKSVALPGEAMLVRLVKPGDQINQGVGYLEDGTMVVVEQGKHAIGQEVSITVTSVLQTPAGRMIFGRIEPRSA